MTKPPLACMLLLAGCGSSSGPPNVILVSMDSMRADHLTTYGAVHDTMPWVDRLARRGVVFENSFSQSNESAYSHAALFTGRYASEVAEPVYRTYSVPEQATLVSEVLQVYGYDTAAFLAGGHVTSGYGFRQGYDDYDEEEGFASFWHTVPKALDWLAKRSRDKPWFLVVHGYDAHRPYQAPPPFYHAFTDGGGSPLAEQLTRNGSDSERVYDRMFFPSAPLEFFTHQSGAYVLETRSYDRLRITGSVLGTGEPLTDADVVHIQAHYDGALANADHWLGVFLATAEQEGYLDNTLVILTSDHGEDLLDHSFMNHRTSLYDTCTRVPLVIWGPGFEGGRRVPDLVQAIDVVPTILSLAGATPPADLPGRRLQDVVAGTAPPLNAVFVEGVMDMVAVRTATRKLVYTHADLDDPAYAEKLAAASLDPMRFELYDLAADPGEHVNLLASGAAGAVEEAGTLRDRLVDWRRGLTVATTTGGLENVTPEQLQAMKDHGYWELGAEGDP